MSHAFEDFPVGTCLVSTSCPITAEAIMDFGREFDPQVFHLDSKLAEKTLFGGLAASGWHTAAVSMRLFIQIAGPARSKRAKLSMTTPHLTALRPC